LASTKLHPSLSYERRAFRLELRNERGRCFCDLPAAPTYRLATTATSGAATGERDAIRTVRCNGLPLLPLHLRDPQTTGQALHGLTAPIGDLAFLHTDGLFSKGQSLCQEGYSIQHMRVERVLVLV
jgi:hypothetical protein